MEKDFLPVDFQEFLATLVRFNVEFMVVGGWAYQLHVQPRFTKDLDVWLNPSRSNLLRLNLAVSEFLGVADALDVDAALAVLDSGLLGFEVAGLPPFKIEALLRLRGLSFEEAQARVVLLSVGSVVVPVISAEDLVVVKTLAGRPQDLVDVAGLLEMMRLKKAGSE